MSDKTLCVFTSKLPTTVAFIGCEIGGKELGQVGQMGIKGGSLTVEGKSELETGAE